MLEPGSSANSSLKRTKKRWDMNMVMGAMDVVKVASMWMGCPN